jgi:asparagine synthase (glutamine-hydrolysing)
MVFAPLLPQHRADLPWKLERWHHWFAAQGDYEVADRLCYVSAPPVQLHDQLELPATRLNLEGPLQAEYLQMAMHRDRVTYLPDDLLVKTDRAFMSVSLEGRCPFLDYRVVELAAHLPTKMLVEGGTQKVVLRELLYRYVPRELVDRPKAGFNVPLADWFRKELSVPMQEVIADPILESHLGVSRPTLAVLYADHFERRADWSNLLWTVWSLWQWYRARRV